MVKLCTVQIIFIYNIQVKMEILPHIKYILKVVWQVQQNILQNIFREFKDN